MNPNITIKLIIFLAVFSAEILLTKAEFNSKFLSFVKNIHQVEKFDSVFLLFKNFDNEFIRIISTSLKIPVILSNNKVTTSSYYLKEEFNENLLTIVQFDTSDLDLQKQLLKYLQHLRFCKTIFILKNSSRNDLQLNSVFNYCWKNRMINVLAVFEDNFFNKFAYYSYSNFGHFTIEKIFSRKKKNSVIFPNRIQNLNGTTLSVILGGPVPGVIYRKNGKIDGYLGHIFRSFARKHNARLNISNINTSLSYLELRQFVVHNKVEMSGAFPSIVIDPAKYDGYPIILYDWCVMLPVEKHIPIYKVFAFVFHWEAFLLSILIFTMLSVALSVTARRPFFIRYWLQCIRGMLGQSFTEDPQASGSTKIIYSLIFLLGIIMVTSYDAFLQSLMTKPPRQNEIKSLDDLQSSGLKVYIIKEDYLIYIPTNIKQNYSNIFEIESNFENFHRMRDTLNTNYAFTINSPKWEIYKNQQEFLGQHLFH
ncbi:uncharacterized protein LOC129920057 [Episyrphus balteatus]|uniref:uncharacterized protein LOC129920057 n=1 Tax=Episyrphus balteatus TaxID=286459 RepID=UPI002484EBEA|nr:uncharacterized protein LOC129920057 [Episyrphus balteatus]